MFSRKPVPLRHGWLTRAGRYKVEKLPCPRPNAPVDETRPPAGILHTTEGSLEGALSVFAHHYAPHFTVGVDKLGRARIFQHVPLGEMAAALENHTGGVETNRWARVQIEIAGHSQHKLWQPDDKTLDALNSLLRELRIQTGIPMRHAGDGTRGKRWGKKSGWFGHSEVPENSHWDPGKLNWRAVFDWKASR